VLCEKGKQINAIKGLLLKNIMLFSSKGALGRAYLGLITTLALDYRNGLYINN